MWFCRPFDGKGEVGRADTDIRRSWLLRIVVTSWRDPRGSVLVEDAKIRVFNSLRKDVTSIVPYRRKPGDVVGVPIAKDKTIAVE